MWPSQGKARYRLRRTLLRASLGVPQFGTTCTEQAILSSHFREISEYGGVIASQGSDILRKGCHLVSLPPALEQGLGCLVSMPPAFERGLAARVVSTALCVLAVKNSVDLHW